MLHGKKKSLKWSEAAVASTQQEWQECGCHRKGWKTAPLKRGEAAAASCASSKRGCAETTNAIIVMPALLFVRTGSLLGAGCTDHMTPGSRAFGVDKRQPAGSHYPNQIDFSFVFQLGYASAGINNDSSLFCHQAPTLDVGVFAFEDPITNPSIKLWENNTSKEKVCKSERLPRGVCVCIQIWSGALKQHHIGPPDRWHNVGTGVIFWQCENHHAGTFQYRQLVFFIAFCVI